jgi:hypothetical protein
MGENHRLTDGGMTQVPEAGRNVTSRITNPDLRLAGDSPLIPPRL